MRQATWWVLPGVLVLLASAYAGESEFLVWEDDGYDAPSEDVVTGRVDRLIVRGVAATRTAVAVAGLDWPGGGSPSTAVLTCYDAVDGSRAWGALVSEASFGWICADERTFYVGGYSVAAPWLVRAYESSGNMRWTAPSAAGVVRGLAVAAERLYAVGQTYSNTGERLLVVRAYESDTGVGTWEQAYDPPGNDQVTVGRVAVHAGRLFVSARTGGFSGGGQVLVALDAGSGDVLWSDAQGSDYVGASTSVAAGGDLVAVVGFTVSYAPYRRQMILRAHDPQDGTLRWSHAVDTPFYYHGASLAVDDTRVYYAATVGHTDGRYGGQTIVRALRHAAPGDTVWFHAHGERARSTYGRELLLRDDRLYVTGSRKAPTGWFNHDLFLAAHDALDGHVVWTDTHDYADAADAGRFLAATQETLFVAGDYQIHRKHPVDPSSPRSRPRERVFLRAYADRR